jgi:hypothetical protein
VSLTGSGIKGQGSFDPPRRGISTMVIDRRGVLGLERFKVRRARIVGEIWRTPLIYIEQTGGKVQIYIAW